MLPEADAVNVASPRAPVKFRCRYPVTSFVKVPAPAKAVEMVRVPVLVQVPVTVTLGIEMGLAPPIVLAAPEKVWTPVFAV